MAASQVGWPRGSAIASETPSALSSPAVGRRFVLHYAETTPRQRTPPPVRHASFAAGSGLHPPVSASPSTHTLLLKGRSFEVLVLMLVLIMGLPLMLALVMVLLMLLVLRLAANFACARHRLLRAAVTSATVSTARKLRPPVM